MSLPCPQAAHDKRHEAWTPSARLSRQLSCHCSNPAGQGTAHCIRPQRVSGCDSVCSSLLDDCSIRHSAVCALVGKAWLCEPPSHCQPCQLVCLLVPPCLPLHLQPPMRSSACPCWSRGSPACAACCWRCAQGCCCSPGGVGGMRQEGGWNEHCARCQWLLSVAHH